MPQLAPALLVVLAALGLAACGGGSSADAPPANQGAPDGTAGRGAAPVVPSPSDPGRGQDRGAGSLALPDGVPTRAEDDGARAEDRRVIDGWLRALRGGEIARAASFFAEPSKVQNGTPVLTLDSPTERAAFNVALPCGARAAAYGTSGRFTIIEFVLTERVGGDCGGAEGQPARGAIRVRDGKIVEWYRLADDPQTAPGPGAPAPAPPAPAPQVDLGDADPV